MVAYGIYKRIRDKKGHMTLKTKLLSLFKNKYRRVIIISLVIIFNILLASTTITKAGNGLGVIGETSKISIIPPPTTFGTNNWILPESTIFLLSPYNLPTFESQDGQTKIIKYFENVVPSYTDGTVAFIPYDLGAYINSKIL